MDDQQLKPQPLPPHKHHDLLLALQLVAQGGSIRKISKACKIPFRMLHEHVNKKQEYGDIIVPRKTQPHKKEELLLALQLIDNGSSIRSAAKACNIHFLALQQYIKEKKAESGDDSVRKQWNKKKKGSQEPTTVPFWQQLGSRSQIVPIDGDLLNTQQEKPVSDQPPNTQKGANPITKAKKQIWPNSEAKTKKQNWPNAGAKTKKQNWPNAGAKPKKQNWPNTVPKTKKQKWPNAVPKMNQQTWENEPKTTDFQEGIFPSNNHIGYQALPNIPVHLTNSMNPTNPTQSFCPSVSGPPIHPGISDQQGMLSVISQFICASVSGYPNGPGISDQPGFPAVMNQPFCLSVSGYPIGTGISNQPGPPAVMNQPFFSSVSGYPIGPGISDQPGSLAVINQPFCQSVSGYPIGSGISDQPGSPAVINQPFCRSVSGQPIHSGSGEGIRPGGSGQVIGPRVTGQPVRPILTGQPVRPSVTGQAIRPRVTGQPVGPKERMVAFVPASTTNQQILLNTAPASSKIDIFSDPSQTVDVAQIRPVGTGQAIRPRVTGQPVGPKEKLVAFVPASTTNQQKLLNTAPASSKFDIFSDPSQTVDVAQVRQVGTGQPVRPKGKLVAFVSASNIDKLGDRSQSVKVVQGPKFIPLPALQKPETLKSKKAQPTKKKQTILQNTDSKSNIITIIGRKKPPAATNIKKILKFEMKMKTIQDKKKSQENIQHSVVDIPVVKTKAVQDPSGAPHPSGVPQPLGVPQPMGTSQTLGTPQLSLQRAIVPIPNTVQVYGVQDANRTVPRFNGPRTPTPTPQQAPAPEPVVETVFQMELAGPAYVPSTTARTSAPMNQISPTMNATTWRGQQYPVDVYSPFYPKGIPKSFLTQQHGPPSQTNYVDPKSNTPANQVGGPLKVDTEYQDDIPQQYSPSELYTDLDMAHDQDFMDADQSGSNQMGQKRVSAFQRLGPQKAKKPKITISVTVNDDQQVREVVDETDQEEITPVHLRENVMQSEDETVKKYLRVWPWKRNVIVKKSVTARNSKTVMMLELEQMEQIYDKDTVFVQVTVKGYPSSWKKEDVLDTLMENIRGYSFIPCFIEFTKEECKFLTLRCRSALLSLHKCGFIIRKENIELVVILAETELTLKNLDFVPRLVLRKRLLMGGDKESVLDLSAFTLKEDISHFIYFPLNRLNNQMELAEMQNEISWDNITELNLSHNRITSLDGFDLERSVPKLKHLNLSHNHLDKITLLLKCRGLPLKSICLEGNPLCRNYIDPDEYIKVVKMIFTSVSTIDDVQIQLKGDMPKFHRIYCPINAKHLTDKFLQIYYRLLDENLDNRELLEDMYDNNATMTVTYNYKLAFSPVYRCYKSLFMNARHLMEGKMNVIKGPAAIIRAITSWPQTQHYPFTFTVDVVYHSDTTTIIRVDGILKLANESLSEDEYLLSFSRTVVLHTKNMTEYKIQAETLYWSNLSGVFGSSAFADTTLKPKLYPTIDSVTDAHLQKELLKIFMRLTTMNKIVSERCLEMKKWNLCEALDHFTKLWKLDNIEALTMEVS